MELIGFPREPRGPERDFIDLLKAWGEGERTLPTYMAFGGFLYIVFILATLVFQVAAGG